MMTLVKNHWLLAVLLTGVVGLILVAGFLNSRSVLATDSNYPAPQPLIISRPIPHPDPTPDKGAEIVVDQTSDQPLVVESEPSPSPSDPNSEADPLVSEPIETDEVTSIIQSAECQDAKPTAPVESSESSDSSLRNTRAILWGVVASMATFLILGSLVFRRQKQD